MRLSILILGTLVIASWHPARGAPGDAASDAAAITAAVADRHRPQEQRDRDTQRLPEQMLTFAGIKPGDRVGDFMSGNAYFTRLFSRVVGSSGRVYAFIPTEEIKNCPAAEVAGSRAVSQDPMYSNVKLLTGPVNQFSVPERLDVLWTAQNYHDLHDKFMGPADISKVNRAFLNALKPGGALIVVDHAAASGSGLSTTESLHRIDPAIIRREVEAAGFIFDSESKVLANPADDHSRSVFDSGIRGATDQVVLKFHKPQ